MDIITICLEYNSFPMKESNGKILRTVKYLNANYFIIFTLIIFTNNNFSTLIFR